MAIDQRAVDELDDDQLFDAVLLMHAIKHRFVNTFTYGSPTLAIALDLERVGAIRLNVSTVNGLPFYEVVRERKEQVDAA